MRQELQKKVDFGIRLIQAGAQKAAEVGQPIEIAYSGGKDSDCILELARMAGVNYRNYYIGIDPGKRGFMCVYDASYSGYKHYPLFDGNRLNRAMIDELWKLAGYRSVMAVVEQVHSMPHQGVASTFSFGTNYGMIIGALEVMGIPYCTVTPGKWQKAICEAVDKASNTKQMHYNAACRLFPNIDFRKSERSRTWDDNKVDATLICEYGKRKQL